jgi:hypothetical protein
MLMKQVTRSVVGETELRVVDPRSERARKSAIAFVPHRHTLVISTHLPRREKPDPSLTNAVCPPFTDVVAP